MAVAAAVLRLPGPTSFIILSGLPKLSSTLPPSLHFRRRRLRCCSSTTSPSPASDPLLPQLRQDVLDDEDADYLSELEDGIQEEPDVAAAAAVPLPELPSPKLTVKEKKELAAYAHSLGKKLKSQQVGKSGVTPSVAASFVENLEANELLKLKIHSNCPGELVDVISQLEKSTGSVAVGQIGKTVILYRPSLSKIKKKEAQSAATKRWKAKPTDPVPTFKLQQKRPVPGVAGRGNNLNRHS